MLRNFNTSDSIDIPVQIVKNFDRVTSALNQSPWMREVIEPQFSPAEFDIQHTWIKQLNLRGKRVNLINGGIGFFAVPLALGAGASKVTIYDMCPSQHEIAYTIHGERWGPLFDHVQCDTIFDDDQIGFAEVWVNTSCEHTLPLVKERWNIHSLVLSGNEQVSRGHVNPIRSVDSLVAQYALEDVYFSTTLKVPYEQHMVIGL